MNMTCHQRLKKNAKLEKLPSLTTSLQLQCLCPLRFCFRVENILVLLLGFGRKCKQLVLTDVCNYCQALPQGWLKQAQEIHLGDFGLSPVCKK